MNTDRNTVRRGIAVVLSMLLVASAFVGFTGTVSADDHLSGTDIAFCGNQDISHYDIIVGDLEDAGATVTVITEPTADTLEDYDVFWLDEESNNVDDGTCTFTEDSVSDIVEFVEDGGALLIHGDNLYDETESLLDAYGIGTTEGVGELSDDFRSHPVTEGLETVDIPNSGNLATVSGDAIDVVRNADGIPTVVVASSGDGRMAFMSDDYMFPGNIVDYDNQLLANNVFDWLAGASGGDDDDQDESERLSVAHFKLADSELSAEEVTVGESVTVSFDVENVGRASGDYIATVTTNGDEIHQETVEIDPEEQGSVSFEYTFTEQGTYQLWVNNDDSRDRFDRNRYLGTVKVNSPPAAPAPMGDPADLVIRHAYITQGPTAPGMPYSVVAIVSNTGEQAQYELTYTGDSVNAADKSMTSVVHFEAGETKVVEMGAFAPESGTETWALNGVPLGSVSAPATTGVVHAYVTEANADPEDEYTVAAVVHNTDATGKLMILRFDAQNGETSEAATLQNGRMKFIWLSAGQTRTVTYIATGQLPGEYDWTVSDAMTGTNASTTPVSVTG